MKITVLTKISRKAGGLQSSVKGLSLANNKLKIDQTILSPKDEFTDLDRALWTPLKVILYPAFGPLQISSVLQRIFRTLNTDVVHCHGLWQDTQRITMHWQTNTGRPVVISPHGMLDPWALCNSAWKKKIVGKLFANSSLQNATCLHALCRLEAESIRAYGLKNPIAIIPNGVELPALDVDRNYKEKCLEGRKKRLLFMGRIHPKKGLSELLKAWKLVLSGKDQNAESWQLVIAGWDDGGLLKRLHKQVIDLDLVMADCSEQNYCRDYHLIEEANVVFSGPVFGEEKDSLFRSVHACILPSFSEGLPMSVLEAWSYGLPVVMTDFCNIPEGFLAGAAFRIAPDSESIAEGLAQLFVLKETDICSMGFKGRMIVEEKFQWENIAQGMKSVYEWCLGGNRPDCLYFG